MFEQKCIVCGRIFDAANPRYCLCSDECRAIRVKQTSAAWHKEYNQTDKAKKKRKKAYLERRELIQKFCLSCGTKLPDGRQSYCLPCLLKDYLAAAGTKDYSKAKQRLYNRGFDKELITDELIKRGLLKTPF